MAGFTIREAVPNDAASFIALIKSVVAEYPDVDMPFTPEEYNPAVEGIEDWITKSGETDNALFLVAVADHQVIGTLICQGGRLAADRHDTSLSIYVHKAWRNQHVGHALMQRAIEWAKNTGVVERIHLEVYARNQRGIHLYEKFGFEHEGRKRRAYYQGGEYLDMLLMSLLLKPLREAEG